MININSFPSDAIGYTSPIYPNILANPLAATHFSVGGIGGYMEVHTIQDMYSIPSIVGEAGNLINPDGLSSGRRKLGMIVHVLDDNKYYQLVPKYKMSKKVIPWDILANIPDNFRGFLLNPFAFTYWGNNDSSVSFDFNIIKQNLELSTARNVDDDFNELKYYGISDGSGGVYADFLVGIGNPDVGAVVEGVIPDPADCWVEIFIKTWEDKVNEISLPSVPKLNKRKVFYTADNLSSVPSSTSDTSYVTNIATNSSSLSDGSVFNVPVSTTAKRIVIAYPSAYGDLTRVIDSSTGFNITRSFSKYQVNGIQTQIGEDESQNPIYSADDYFVYISLLALSYSSANTYVVTI